MTTLIRPGNVLFIVNTDVALSEPAARWYARERGLQFHVVRAALGTANASSATREDLSTFIDDVAEAMVDVDADAVLCSVGTPMTFVNTSLGLREWNSFSALCGHARAYLADGDNVTAVSQESVYTQTWLWESEYDGTYPSGYAQSNHVPWTMNWRDSYVKGIARSVVRPWGRLGLPDYRTGGSLSTETMVDLQRIVRHAKRSELGLAGHTDKEHVFSLHERVANYYYNGYYAMQEAVDGGVTNVTFWENDTGVATPDPGTADYTHATVVAGSQSPAISFFVYMGTALENPWSTVEGTGSAYLSSMSPLQGAVCFEDTSFHHVGQDLLRKGASCYVSAISEPYSDGPPSMSAIMRALLDGKTVAEANFLGNLKCPGAVVVVGDPLYAPYLERTNERKAV